MIIELLQEIAKPGPKSNMDLGKHLGISEAIITELLSDLKKRGYLHRQELCTTGCSNCTHMCPFAGSNSEPMVFWELTEKGRKALGNH
jgi:DNA-binding HxlR family transcriptional regulator